LTFGRKLFAKLNGRTSALHHPHKAEIIVEILLLEGKLALMMIIDLRAFGDTGNLISHWE